MEGESRARIRRLPKAVWLLGWTSLLTDVSSDMIVPLLPLFLTQVLGGAAWFVGLVDGVADAVSAVLRLVAGRLSDRMGRRKPLVVAGYGLAGFARPLVALAAAPWQVLAIRVADRFGKGLRSGPRDALIADVAPPELVGRAFGVQRAMDHAGAMLGPLVAAGLLAAGFELRTVFAWAALPAVLAFACALRVRESARTESSPAPAVPRSPAAGWWPRGRLGSLLLVMLVFAVGNATDGFLLLRLHELGLSAALVPASWALHHACKVGSTLLGGRLADRGGRVGLIVTGWLAFAATYAGLAVCTSAWQGVALLVAYGLYHGLSEPAEKALVRDLAAAADRGRAYGAYHSVLGFASLAAGLLTGLLWTRFGSAVALGTSAALAVAASIALLEWRRRGAGRGEAR